MRPSGFNAARAGTRVTAGQSQSGSADGKPPARTGLRKIANRRRDSKAPPVEAKADETPPKEPLLKQLRRSVINIGNAREKHSEPSAPNAVDVLAAHRKALNVLGEFLGYHALDPDVAKQLWLAHQDTLGQLLEALRASNIGVDAMQELLGGSRGENVLVQPSAVGGVKPASFLVPRSAIEMLCKPEALRDIAGRMVEPAESPQTRARARTQSAANVRRVPKPLPRPKSQVSVVRERRRADSERIEKRKAIDEMVQQEIESGLRIAGQFRELMVLVRDAADGRPTVDQLLEAMEAVLRRDGQLPASGIGEPLAKMFRRIDSALTQLQARQAHGDDVTAGSMELLATCRKLLDAMIERADDLQLQRQ